MDLTGVDLSSETVRTGRLLMRPPVEADVDPITRACQDPDDQRWLSMLPSPYTRDAAVEFVTGIAARGRAAGNDLSTPRPEYGFPGLRPGDRWCVVAVRWLQAYQAGAAAGVVLAATNARALDVVPLEALRQHAVDVPDDLSGLD